MNLWPLAILASLALLLLKVFGAAAALSWWIVALPVLIVLGVSILGVILVVVGSALVAVALAKEARK